MVALDAVAFLPIQLSTQALSCCSASTLSLFYSYDDPESGPEPDSDFNNDDLRDTEVSWIDGSKNIIPATPRPPRRLSKPDTAASPKAERIQRRSLRNASLSAVRTQQ